MGFIGKYAFGNPDPPCWYTYQNDPDAGIYGSLSIIDPTTQADY